METLVAIVMDIQIWRDSGEMVIRFNQKHIFWIVTNTTADLLSYFIEFMLVKQPSRQLKQAML